jgi:hypothetical protein
MDASSDSEASAPRVSVVILNYNGLEFAKQCIQSVVESDYQNLEVIVVDNGSTDGSYEIVCQLFNNNTNVEIVRNPRNLGFAEGNNIGYRHSKGAIIVFGQRCKK